MVKRIKTPESSIEEKLRTEIREIISLSPFSQVYLSKELNVSQQHMSDMLTGKSALGLHFAERIARLCGWELYIAFRPMRKQRKKESNGPNDSGAGGKGTAG